MTSSLGFGLARILPAAYSDGTGAELLPFDNVVFNLRDAVAPDADLELCDLYDAECFMCSQQESDPERGIFMAALGSGGPLPADVSARILEDVERVGASLSVPSAFADFMPTISARIFLPGLAPTSAVQHHVIDGIRLSFPNEHPLAGASCASLEQALEALRSWRDKLARDELQTTGVDRENALETYARLLPMLETALEHRLIFTW